MSTPVFIAVNQTAYDIELTDLRLVVPASNQINLSNFNEIWRIQADSQLYSYVDGYSILINNGTSTLTRDQSLQYLSPIASSQPIASSATTTSAGYMSAQDKVNLDKTLIGKVIRVAKSGGDYSSVKAAIDSITDSSKSNPYVIQVFPGDYTEDPFTMKTYVNIHGMGTWMDTVLRTTNNSTHFITGAAGGTLSYLCLVGPTGTGYAAVDYTAAGYTPLMLYHLVIRRGYYGIYVHPSSYGTIHAHEVVNQYDSSPMHCFFHIINGNATLMTCSFMSGPANSVAVGFHADGANTTLTMDNCAFRNSGNSDAVFVDNGAKIRLSACTLSDGYNAIHVGSIGSGTEVSAAACVIGEAFSKDVFIESNSAIIAFNGAAHQSKFYIAPGATFTGSIHDSTIGSPNTTVFGEFYIGNTPETVFPLGKFAQAYTTTGVFLGGGIERVSGLQVKILAGQGLATDAIGLLKVITWSDSTIILSPNELQLYISIDDAGVISSNINPPDLTRKIFQGRVSTSATDVIFLSSGQIEIPQPAARLWDYTTEVIGPISYSGGTVTKHTNVGLELNVEGGEFYAHNVRKTFIGATPITFTYWYRDGYAGWKSILGQTTIDGYHYDDGYGVLANIPSGKYSRDLLFATTNNSGTEYHLVYSQEYYNDVIDAITNPSIPSFLLDSSCRLAAIICQEGTSDIYSIIDQRPKLGQMASATTSITKHGDLSGLSSNDHPQYQLISGKGVANGYAALDATSKITLLALPLHSSSHYSSGTDAIDHNSLTNYSSNKHIDHASVSIATSNGLQGGGDISATRTLSPVYGSSSNTICQGNDSRLSDDRTASGLRTTTNTVIISASAAPTIGQTLMATSPTTAIWKTHISGGDGYIQYNNNGALGSNINFTYDKINTSVNIGQAVATLNSTLNMAGNVDSYVQTTLTNKNSGTSASADFVANADNSTETSYYVDLGINSSTYSDSNWSILAPNDSYLYSSDTNMLIGTTAVGQSVKFFTGGSLSSNLRATINNNGIVLPAGHSYYVDGYVTVLTNDSRLIDSRTPTTHASSHKNGGSDEVATATSAANAIPKAGAGGTLSIGWIPTGSTSSTVCIGNDSRLSDARTPITHASSHNAGGSDALAIDAAAATGSLRTIGTGALQACAGNDSRLTDSRTPTAHASSHQNGGSDEVATATAAANAIPKANASAKLDIGWLSTGSTSTTVCVGNDSRLSDDRTASGLRTATTIVVVSNATAPSSGQALVATSSTAATWQSVSTLTSTAPVNVDAADAAVGVGTTAARHDHKHDVNHAAPVSTGSANADGTATTLALSDHVHLALPVVTEVSMTSTITTNSTSDVLMTGMTITPAAGNYMVWFTGDIYNNQSSSNMIADIWAAGTVVTASERTLVSSNTTNHFNFATQAKVTVNGSQAIEGRWRTVSGNTNTNTRRTLSIMRVL
jgi:hypothetical protein